MPDDTDGKSIEQRTYGTGWAKCRVCGLIASDIIDGSCPSTDRCKRVIKGQPLSSDKRFGDGGPERYEP